MANRYLRASGNWNGPVWAATSSGAAGSAATPTADDNVYISANFTVTLTSDTICYLMNQSSGRVNIGSNKLTIRVSYESTGSSARTLDMGSGTVEVGPLSGVVEMFRLEGSNMTLIAGTSRLVLNNNTSSWARNFRTLSKTFNDVIINLGSGSFSTTTNITGSPTFRSLTIQSKNSAAHTVLHAPFSTKKLIIIGSSASNRLIFGETDTSFVSFANGTDTYGQFVDMRSANYSADRRTHYIGSNSVQTNGAGWLLQDPPKISTLADEFNNLDTNTWQTVNSGTGSISVSGGKLNMGWFGGSPSFVSITSKDTFDLVDSATYIKVDSNAIDLFIGVQPVYDKNATSISISTEKVLSERHYRISGTSAGVVTIDKFDGSWTNMLTETVNPLQLRSVRLNISGSRNMSDGYMVIDRIGTSYPSLSTGSATSITTTTATLGGNVTSDGGNTVTERGVVWSTSANPTTSDSKKTTSGTTGSYTVNVTGLSPKTTYHYRAYAINSEGTGYGEDKTFTTLGEPTAQFNASPKTGKRPVTVYFTDQSTFAPTSWSWNFGDGGTSTTKNPQHTYSSGGSYTVSLTATNAYGSDTETKTSYITIDIESFSGAIDGTLTLGGAVQRPRKQTYGSIEGTLMFGGSLRSIVLKDTQSVDTKKYLYKVYDEQGNYIEVWKDVISEPNFTVEINQIGSTMDVELARTSDSLGVTTSNLLTESDAVVQTEDNLPILVRTASRNQIGPGSSVQYNNRVDVYAYYGAVEPLLTEGYEPITTEDGEVLLASTGAPNGRRIFTGFISEINTRYGNTDTVQLQLTSYGWDLNQYPITNLADETTVSFLSVDPSDIVRDALDKFVTDSAPYYTYTNWQSQTIESTGTTVSYTFKANTYADVLDKTLELMPENWYYYVGLGDNLVYFRERSQTAQHRFFLGKHIKALDLKGSILDVINRVLFTGGGDPALYIERVEAPAPRTRRSLELYSDGRVTVESSAEIISDGMIEKQNKVNYRTTIEILSGAYDIESINVGDVVGFRNFGNFVDELLLQIVGISYSPDVVQLQLETKPPTINKRLADIQRNLKVQENQDVPNAPQ